MNAPGIHVHHRDPGHRRIQDKHDTGRDQDPQGAAGGRPPRWPGNWNSGPFAWKDSQKADGRFEAPTTPTQPRTSWPG